MDLFTEKNISPMLIAQMQEPFNDPDWIYELKLDGCRCIAYLEEDRSILRNKRNMELLPRFPELKDIHTSVKDRCILDGELVVMINGVPEFYELQKRTLMTNPVKISMAAGLLPASFVAYDCLQVNDRILLDTPLMERKVILQELVQENERIAVSRYIEEKGTELYELTVHDNLYLSFTEPNLAERYEKIQEVLNQIHSEMEGMKDIEKIGTIINPGRRMLIITTI